MFNYLKNLFSTRSKSQYSTAVNINDYFGIESGKELKLLHQYGESIYLYIAISKIARTASSVEIDLKEIKGSKGDVIQHNSHDILDLIYNPNPIQTRSEFWKLAYINRLLTGDAFIYLVRREGSEGVQGSPVLGMWNIRPDLMKVIVSRETGEITRYELNLENGRKKIFHPNDIVHIKEPDPLNALRGMSPLRPARFRIETEKEASNFQRNFFKNQARPDAILKTQSDLTPEQIKQAKQAWFKQFGNGKGGGMAFLAGGLEYQQVGISQKDMDYINSQKFMRDDILAVLGVPKALVTTDDVNRANADSAMHQFMSQTIKPLVADFVECLNYKLINPNFGGQYYLDFEDPTPQDKDMQLKYLQAGIHNWLTANEAREIVGLDPLEGISEADQLMKPTGVVPIDTPAPVGFGGVSQFNGFKGKHGLKKALQANEYFDKEVCCEINKKIK